VTVPQRVFFREAINRALVEEMTRDERVILMGQDIGAFGGSYQETRGLLARFGDRRVRDTPVAEAATMGIAVGAAAAGLRPIVFITYMDFLTLGMDALVNYGAKLSYKTAGQLRAPLVVKVTAGAKGQGVAHSQAFEAWLMNVPGLKVVAPSSAADAYGLLKSAIRDEGPVVFIDHKRLFPRPGWVPEEETVVPLGRANLRRSGTGPTVVCHGYITTVAEDAAERLAAEGVSCEVLDLRCLWPIDLGAICASAARTGAVLFVEEGQTICGVGAELAFQVREHLPHLRVARLGARRAPISSNPVFEAYCLPDVERICQAVRSMLQHEDLSSPGDISTRYRDPTHRGTD
jgi:pyruvate/2-oxoglutarate/acetoin dehydrogenase E1 component